MIRKRGHNTIYSLGRVFKRGQLILCLLSAAAIATYSQQTSADITPEQTTRLRPMISSGSIEEVRTALFEIRNFRSAAASSLALPALTNQDAVVRATAAGSVIFLPKTEAAMALLPLLEDRSEFVRREAAFALGEVGDASATAPLIRLMKNDKIFEVKAASAAALGKIGDSSAVESLVAVLRTRPVEDAEFLRRSAARSIGQIAEINSGGKASAVTPQNFLPEKFKDAGTGAGPSSGLATAVDTLIGVLRNKAEADDTRREAAFALGAIGDPRAIPTLQSYSSSPDPYLAEIVREALLKIERRNKPAVSVN